MSLRFLLPLCVAACIVLAGCAPLPPAEGNLGRWESADLARFEARLRDSPHRIRDPALEAWLAELLLRIDPSQGGELRLYLLDLRAPQADLIGERLLQVRAGLLSELRTEAELVFVLAHELAHRHLGHVEMRRRRDWDAERAEREADRAALLALSRLGYASGAGAELLTRMHGRVTQPDDRRRLQNRIAALDAAIPSPQIKRLAVPDPRFEHLLAPYRTRARAE